MAREVEVDVIVVRPSGTMARVTYEPNSVQEGYLFSPDPQVRALALLTFMEVAHEAVAERERR